MDANGRPYHYLPAYGAGLPPPQQQHHQQQQQQQSGSPSHARGPARAATYDGYSHVPAHENGQSSQLHSQENSPASNSGHPGQQQFREGAAANSRKRKSMAQTIESDHDPEHERGDHEHEQDNEHDDDGESTQGGQNKKKRNRAVLSCKPCKARKIKCDRNHPCTSCVKRGIPKDCVWDDPSKIVEAQPFASATELDDLRAHLDTVNARLEDVEALISRIPTDILKAIVDPKAESDGEPDGDGEEAAVGALEELALGHHLQQEKSASDLSKGLMGRGAFSMGYRAGNGREFPSSSPLQMPFENTGAGHIASTLPGSTDVRSKLGDTAHGMRQEARTSSTIYLPARPGLEYGEGEPQTEFRLAIAPANQVRTALKALPTRHVSDILMQFYFDDCSWVARSQHLPYFKAEYAEFSQFMDKGGDPVLVDPAWLAVLLMSLAIAARAMPLDLLPHEDPHLLNALPGQFFEASTMLLTAAKWTTKPQFRTIQTCGLMGPYFWYTANRNEGLVWLASAIRIAQLMKMHKLGDDPTLMPEWEDLAFPTGPSSIKRQMTVRMWSNLMFLDATYASTRDKVTFYPVTGADTALPINCDDSDLGAHVQVTPKPQWVLTDMTFDLIRWAMALSWRFVDSDEKRSYDDILSQDASVRKMLSSVPPDLTTLTLDGSVRARQMLWKRNTLFSGIYSQIIRLHRPFFYKSFKNAKYEPSRSACISSAIAIINYGCPLHYISRQERFWFTYVHLFGAVICLLLDLLHSIDLPSPDGQAITEERIDQVQKAVTIFQHAKNESRLKSAKHIGCLGESLVNAVIAAARERQALNASGKGAKETYAETMRRIAATLEAKQNDWAARAGKQAFEQPHHPSSRRGAPERSETETFANDPATTELLRSLGLSMDTIVEQSPQGSSASSTGNGNCAGGAGGTYQLGPRQGVAGNGGNSDAIFDTLFTGGDMMSDDFWGTHVTYPTY